MCLFWELEVGGHWDLNLDPYLDIAWSYFFSKKNQERLVASGDRERELQRKLMEAELKLEQRVRDDASPDHYMRSCIHA